jgi:ABC-type branched-subunit amino acid transport system substrate-binding protein
MLLRPRRRAAGAFLALLALAGAACGGRDDDDDAGGTTTTAEGGGGSTTTEPASASRLDAGGFGDLENVCQEGDASGATDTGVTDTSITVGTLTDKGATIRPGLTQEMYDAAVAFAAWCNEHGGINGRELIISDRDSALFNYNDAITAACAEDFALVGGGSVLDDADNGGRVACGLAQIPGYVVTVTAREADLNVQPVPNPVDNVAAGHYRRIAEQNPDFVDAFGIMTSTFGATVTTRDQSVAAVEQLGYTVVYSGTYNPQGESNWRPFVEQMRDAGVEVFEFIGEPENLSNLLSAMDTVGYFPEIIIEQTNMYDERLVELAGDFAQNVFIRSAYTPFELADQNPATADYLELMERYNPGGKVAQLGTQGISAFLLFAQSATACGADLTRACLMEQAESVTEWTGGGLHAPTSPGENIAPDCGLIIALTPDGFVYDEEFTAPNEGLFNCDPENVVSVDVG